jgi:hypothetical protein
MDGGMSTMVDRGKAVISELYNWLRDLLRLRVTELAYIRNELSKRLAETQVYVHNIVFSLNEDDLKDVSHHPVITLYLYDEETYPDLIKVELNTSCVVSGDETVLSDIKPDVTVLGFVKAFALMDEEFTEIRHRIYPSITKKKITILDKPIATLWESRLTELKVDNFFIDFDMNLNGDVFDVNVTKEPFLCTYKLLGHQPLKFAINLFKKYIAPLLNNQAHG